MIARYYGKRYSLQTIRDRSFITREGVSMLGIVLLLLAGSAWFSYPETVVTEFALSVGKDGLPKGTARVGMQDIGKIRSGQRAVIHLTGFPEETYGFMEGNIEGGLFYSGCKRELRAFGSSFRRNGGAVQIGAFAS